MAAKPFHLGWFMNFTPDEWNDPFAGRRHALGRQVLRRHGAGAGASLLRLHHARGHADGVGGLRRHTEAYLKHAHAWCRSTIPSPLAALIGAGDHAGSASSPRCPPWPIRRSCWRGSAPRSTTSPAAASAGTSSPAARMLAAQNFGMDKLPPREQRYDMADEYVDLVSQLFDSLGRRTRSCSTARPAPTPITPRSGRSTSRASTSSAAGR